MFEVLTHCSFEYIRLALSHSIILLQKHFIENRKQSVWDFDQDRVKRLANLIPTKQVNNPTRLSKTTTLVRWILNKANNKPSGVYTQTAVRSPSKQGGRLALSCGAAAIPLSPASLALISAKLLSIRCLHPHPWTENLTQRQHDF